VAREPGKRGHTLVTIDKAAEWFLGGIAQPGMSFSRSQATVKRRIRTYRMFLEYIHKVYPDLKYISSISAKHINGEEGGRDGHSPGQPAGWATYRRLNGIKPNTILTELSDIRSLMEFAYRESWIRDVPRFLSPPMERAVRPIVMPASRVIQIVRGQPTEFRRACLLTLACTGLRQGELRSLPFTAYDSAVPVLNVPKQMTVRTKLHQRSIPVGPNLAKALNGLCQMNAGQFYLFAVKGKMITSQLNEWLKPWGCSPHDLRRWFQATLESCDCPSYRIDDFMGHAPGRTRGAYTPSLRWEDAIKHIMDIDKIFND